MTPGRERTSEMVEAGSCLGSVRADMRLLIRPLLQQWSPCPACPYLHGWPTRRRRRRRRAESLEVISPLNRVDSSWVQDGTTS